MNAKLNETQFLPFIDHYNLYSISMTDIRIDAC